MSVGPTRSAAVAEKADRTVQRLFNYTQYNVLKWTSCEITEISYGDLGLRVFLICSSHGSRCGEFEGAGSVYRDESCQMLFR